MASFACSTVTLIRSDHVSSELKPRRASGLLLFSCKKATFIRSRQRWRAWGSWASLAIPMMAQNLGLLSQDELQQVVTKADLGFQRLGLADGQADVDGPHGQMA